VGAIFHDEPWSLFYSLLSIQAVDKIPWVGEQPAERPLPTQDNTNRINANIHASSWI
jgi:hypothetical protein